MNNEDGEKKKSHGPRPFVIYLIYFHAQGRDYKRIQSNPHTAADAYGFLTPCLNQRRPSLLHNRTSSGYTAGQDLFPLITTRSRHSVWQGIRNPILSLIE